MQVTRYGLGVAICRIIVSFARVCRVGVWFGFVRSALLLAVGACSIVVRGDAWPLLLSPCNTHTHTHPRQLCPDLWLTLLEYLAPFAALGVAGPLSLSPCDVYGRTHPQPHHGINTGFVATLTQLGVIVCLQCRMLAVLCHS